MGKAERSRPNGYLIPTKYALPDLREDDIVRERLRQELDLALQYPLTLVCAQAGSGKTTAVADWARAYATCTAWLALEEKDNDPSRFWRYLVASLHHTDSTIGLDRGVPLAISPEQHLSDDALADLIDAIVRRGERLIFVIDNYQEIRSPAIHRFLSGWIAHTPPFCHIIVISQAEPSLPLAAFRARNQLKQISNAELRFSREEASRFYRIKARQTLTSEEVNIIYAKTDGWATGMRLIGLALENSKNLHGNLQALTGNHPYINAFLTEEIIAKQPPDIRLLMMSVSLLDRFSYELCQAIGGEDADGAALLRVIVQNNLFVLPVDDEQTWFRFHPLFTDVLRARIADELTPDDTVRVHRRAAVWFERQHLIQEAIQHAIAGGETEKAVKLLAAHVPALLHEVESPLLLQWIETIRSTWCEDSIPLSILQGQVLLLLGRYEEASAAFDELERHLLANAGDDRAAALDELASERAILAMVRAIGKGDVEALMEHMLLDTERHEFMGIIGEKDAEDALLHRGMWGFHGRLATAERFFIEAKRLTDDYGPPSQLTGSVFATLGEIYYEWNELEASLTCLEHGMAEGLKYENWLVRVSCSMALSRVRYAQGSREGAIAVLRAMKDELRAAGAISWLPALTAAEIRMEIADGRLEAVHVWLTDLSHAEGTESRFATEFERMTHVRALLSVGTVSQALELLEQIGWKAEKEKRVGSLIETAVLQALCYASQKKEKLALAALERGVRMAIADRYARLFVDEGQPMMALLSALHEGAPVEIRDWIQDRLALFPKPPFMESAGLTAQELAVLRKLAEGKTNLEISEQLSIALGTVKAHTNKIYQKLGVKNRVQALQLVGFGTHHELQTDTSP